MMGYVANLLQVCNAKGESSILLSESAFNLLDPNQRIALERHGRLVPVAIPIIEAVGGGSVRSRSPRISCRGGRT
ncbi:MAG: hypothetical protein IPG74_15485 [Flavobacteriales bacterium]|nr:hypothetical protein [Flavobacteriales bacterium]